MLHACDFRHGRRGFWAIVESGMGSCRVFYSLFFCEIFLSGYDLETDSTCSLMLPTNCSSCFALLDHFQHKDHIIHCKLWHEQIYTLSVMTNCISTLLWESSTYLQSTVSIACSFQWFGVGNCPLEALGDLAKLKPKERVLIHAAAGGVGLVAIQSPGSKVKSYSSFVGKWIRIYIAYVFVCTYIYT